MELETLMIKAVKRSGKISPCTGKTWSECVTEETISGRAVTMLYYNTDDHSTHVVIVESNS